MMNMELEKNFQFEPWSDTLFILNYKGKNKLSTMMENEMFWNIALEKVIQTRFQHHRITTCFFV
jgi:hypothetical protein